MVRPSFVTIVPAVGWTWTVVSSRFCRRDDKLCHFGTAQMRFRRRGRKHSPSAGAGAFCPKSNKEQRITPLLPGLYPPPGTRQIQLLQLRPRRTGAGRLCCLRGGIPRFIVVDNAVF